MELDDIQAAARVAQGGGYRPLRLTLIGFKGIRSGLGRDSITLDIDELAGDATLVAIAGANGRGKTTVMDNLHPFMVMPSRAGADGLGAFSYYDHVFLPESQKDLVWEHQGRRYRSQIVLRIAGKRRTEAFLFEQNGRDWKPVVRGDGTVSDGKVDTYEQCLREVLGSPETFFTSVFSAQGKRPLSAYRNAEIKTLLADLLGLEQVREQGARAAETARLLKSGLAVVRQEQSELASTICRLEAETVGPACAVGALQQAAAVRLAAEQALARARGEEADVASESKVAQVTEPRRRELLAEAERIRSQAAGTQARLNEEARRIDARKVSLLQRVGARQRQHAQRRSELLQQRDALRQASGSASIVIRATVRLALAERVALARVRCAADAQALVEKATQLRNRDAMLRQDLAGIDREAGQVALRNADLLRRLGLTAEVPCAGTDLQEVCKLLGDARQAQALKPSVEARIAALAERKRSGLQEMAAVRAQLALLAGAADRRNEAERRLELAQGRAAKLARQAARAGEIRQAQSLLRKVETDLSAMAETAPVETEDEAAERNGIARCAQSVTADRLRVKTEREVALARIEAALGALPAAFDGARLDRCRRAIEQATGALRDAERAVLDAVRQEDRHAALRAALDQARARAATAEARAGGIEQELAGWLLLARCLSNDGVIALDIDDAGPTLSGLTNDLLLACYGRRYTVEIRTLVETVKGEAREGFDILVHDAETGESKSVALLSGGEKVFVNECLTRAIALYLAQDAGRQYGTLFCDEADGALDPERKRMFMDMKREVLRLGGYRREFFVSQTAELTAMADRVIDLDAFVVTKEGVS